MTTTSLKLPDDLKKRAANVAGQLGISTHAFMVTAIEQAALAAERRARLLAEAKVARHEMIETGKGFEADAVHAYLGAKAAGKPASKPKARTWRG
ncbi:MAG: hypothetical protein IPP18_15205 [Rhodocyclaceae bacterium]|jgi:predicted transcriptional regulator|nr:hypothetical protein [Rhodocyclaceae bacterium]MBK6553098.1 hypothetical protein [Rhodocyclaceae bacterium]MBK9311419.1 hypothetical protein [Rhodocyclaceae bacterium]MBK9956425.1 hypothetical protein [Rhodocyclaceae bacterium]